MNQAQKYVHALRTCQNNYHFSAIVCEAAGMAVAKGYDKQGRTVSCAFADGSAFWMVDGAYNVCVAVGQVWLARNGERVTITRETIGGEFYQFEGSNGMSYGYQGRAFHNRASMHDLVELVTA